MDLSASENSSLTGSSSSTANECPYGQGECCYNLGEHRRVRYADLLYLVPRIGDIINESGAAFIRPTSLRRGTLMQLETD